MKKAHRNLLARVDAEMAHTQSLTGRTELRPDVHHALEVVPRELFVDPSDRACAYDNRPLPIGYGATISQPFIVALMIELLNPGPDDIVLEVGAGSGYAAAVLATIVRRVYTIEIVPELAISARRRLGDLGYDNVEVACGDGYEGWAEHAPYDAFMASAAAPYVPDALVLQLRDGGRFVMPVESDGGEQELVVGTRNAPGDVRVRSVLPVAFVPMVESEVESEVEAES